MDNSNVPSPLASSGGGFFSKPEGKLGIWLPLGIAAVVIFFFGSAIGAFLVNALDNMLHFTIVGGILLALIFMALDGQLRRAFYYGYRSLMRWLARVLLISKDPIGIRETYVEEAQKKFDKLGLDIQRLRGDNIRTQRENAENKRALDEQYGLASVAKRKGDTRNLFLASHEISRCEALDQQYSEILKNYGELLDVSTRWQQICRDTITEMTRDIAWRKKQQRLGAVTHSVMSEMRAIMKGMPGKEMYDDAGDVLDERFTGALGDMEDFSATMGDMLSGADLRDTAAIQAVVEKLERREQALLAPPAPPKVDTKDPPVAAIK